MSLDITKLAKEINKALAVNDAHGQKIKVTSQMETYAKAIINTFHAATTAHAPGTVTGITAPGAPLSAGAAINGTLLSFLPATWLSTMLSGFPTSNPGILSTEANGSTGYISGAAKINFAPGSITGTCTNTPTAPGPLTGGAGSNGTVDALVGAAWATAVIPPLGDPILSKKVYTAIVKYINENAEVSYPPGSVVGTCPSGAGPLSAGAATGGVIS